MHRDLAELARIEYDLLIVGGGVAGVAAAREAALRGLKTALIERNDFGSGASANCFKVIHGGVHCVRQGDLRHLRAMSHERAAFLRLVPHLVKPLPFVIPTYGMGRRAKWFVGAGLLVHDVLSADRNVHTSDPSRRIRSTRFFSRAETLAMFPTLPDAGLTGATSFEDAQIHNPPRLVLAFATAASKLGANVANYVEAERLLVRDRRVHGVAARDVLTGDRFEIRAHVVLNAAGSWSDGLLNAVGASAASRATAWSRNACLVINRRPMGSWALACSSANASNGSLSARATRRFFVAPWRDKTLVGVWQSAAQRDPEVARVTRAELRSYIDEINARQPGFNLREAEVERVDFGVVPQDEASHSGNAMPGLGTMSFEKRSRPIDHRRGDAISGLVTSLSSSFSLARLDAASALGCVMKQSYRKGLDPFNPASVAASVENPERAARNRSAFEPLPGGEFDDFDRLLSHSRRNRPLWLPPASIDALVANFGTHMHRVVAMADADPSLRRCIAGSHVTLAEIAYSVRDEMVQTLADVVFRRTELGTAGHPGEAALSEVLTFLQRVRGWSPARALEERRAVDAHFERHLTATDPVRHATPARAAETETEPDLLTNAI